MKRHSARTYGRLLWFILQMYQFLYSTKMTIKFTDVSSDFITDPPFVAWCHAVQQGCGLEKFYIKNIVNDSHY
ncbi:MAG: hypothetical protein ACREBA_01180 [Nitrosotalea sp.]